MFTFFFIIQVIFLIFTAYSIRELFFEIRIISGIEKEKLDIILEYLHIIYKDMKK